MKSDTRYIIYDTESVVDGALLTTVENSDDSAHLFAVSSAVPAPVQETRWVQISRSVGGGGGPEDTPDGRDVTEKVLQYARDLVRHLLIRAADRHHRGRLVAQQ